MKKNKTVKEPEIDWTRNSKSLTDLVFEKARKAKGLGAKGTLFNVAFDMQKTEEEYKAAGGPPWFKWSKKDGWGYAMMFGSLFCELLRIHGSDQELIDLLKEILNEYQK